MFLLGCVFGAFMWWAFSPLLFDRVADDRITADASDQVLASGQFRDADRAHKGAGDATLVKKIDGSIEIQLENFEVTNGPDLALYVSSSSTIEKASDVTGSIWTNIGKLKGNKGNQVYRLPEDVNIDDVKSVVIWCQAFSVLFSVATLN